MKLDGQVAIVVGSARGIGETIAHTFAQEGASIVLVDLEKMKPQLDGVVQEIIRKGGSAIAIVADCTDDRQVNQMVDETVRRWGKIDILVNSAGPSRTSGSGGRNIGAGMGFSPRCQLEGGFSLLQGGFETDDQAEEWQHCQYLRHRRERRNGSARLAMCGDGALGANADYCQRSRSLRYKSQHHLSRRHGRTGPPGDDAERAKGLGWNFPS